MKRRVLLAWPLSLAAAVLLGWQLHSLAAAPPAPLAADHHKTKAAVDRLEAAHPGAVVFASRQYHRDDGLLVEVRYTLAGGPPLRCWVYFPDDDEPYTLD